MEVTSRTANCRMNSCAEGGDAAHDLHDLMAEAVLYLEVVELFRELGHEPTWRSDELGVPS